MVIKEVYARQRVNYCLSHEEEMSPSQNFYIDHKIIKILQIEGFFFRSHTHFHLKQELSHLSIFPCIYTVM